MTKQVTQYCGHCREKVEFEILFWNVRFEGYKGKKMQTHFVKDGFQAMGDDFAKIFYKNHELSVFCSCPRCKKSSILCYAIADNNYSNLIPPNNYAVGEADVSEFVCAYPAMHHANIEQCWPDNVKKTFSDIEKMMSSEVSAAPILTTIGTALELATKALGQKNGNLKSKINKLADMGIITDGLKEWAHEIRYLRNDGSHDGEGKDTDVQEMFNFLKTFLELTFTLPHKMKERKAISANIPEPKND